MSKLQWQNSTESIPKNTLDFKAFGLRQALTIPANLRIARRISDLIKAVFVVLESCRNRFLQLILSEIVAVVLEVGVK
jgi:hypothetical protein